MVVRFIFHLKFFYLFMFCMFLCLEFFLYYWGDGGFILVCLRFSCFFCFYFVFFVIRLGGAGVRVGVGGGVVFGWVGWGGDGTF